MHDSRLCSFGVCHGALGRSRSRRGGAARQPRDRAGCWKGVACFEKVALPASRVSNTPFSPVFRSSLLNDTFCTIPMGFCRRCGDIVVGPRCKCGGSSVGQSHLPLALPDRPSEYMYSTCCEVESVRWQVSGSLVQDLCYPRQASRQIPNQTAL